MLRSISCALLLGTMIASAQNNSQATSKRYTHWTWDQSTDVSSCKVDSMPGESRSWSANENLSHFGGQIKFECHNLSKILYVICRADTSADVCHNDRPTIFRGRTDRFGFFNVPTMDAGTYVAVFKLPQGNVALRFTTGAYKNYKLGDDSSPMRLNVLKGTLEVQMGMWVVVD